MYFDFFLLSFDWNMIDFSCIICCFSVLKCKIRRNPCDYQFWYGLNFCKVFKCFSSNCIKFRMQGVCFNWSSGRFDPKNSLYLSFVCISLVKCRFDPKNSLYPSLVCISRSSGRFDPKNSLYLSFVPWFVYPVNVYLNPQWYDMPC
jgi:hypothetical protein